MARFWYLYVGINVVLKTSWMRKHSISERFWVSEKNFEILNLKNCKNKLSGNAGDLWQHSSVKSSKAVKIHTDRPFGEPGTGHFGSLGGPKFPPPGSGAGPGDYYRAGWLGDPGSPLPSDRSGPTRQWGWGWGSGTWHGPHPCGASPPTARGRGRGEGRETAAPPPAQGRSLHHRPCADICFSAFLNEP